MFNKNLNLYNIGLDFFTTYLICLSHFRWLSIIIPKYFVSLTDFTNKVSLPILLIVNFSYIVILPSIYNWNKSFKLRWKNSTVLISFLTIPISILWCLWCKYFLSSFRTIPLISMILDFHLFSFLWFTVSNTSAKSMKIHKDAD